MATANPFAGFDFSKFTGDFKVPAFDVEKVLSGGVEVNVLFVLRTD